MYISDYLVRFTYCYKLTFQCLLVDLLLHIRMSRLTNKFKHLPSFALAYLSSHKWKHLTLILALYILMSIWQLIKDYIHQVTISQIINHQIEYMALWRCLFWWCLMWRCKKAVQRIRQEEPDSFYLCLKVNSKLLFYI